MDVSIVTGTYNRLPYLKQMVNSTRTSVGPLDYEIVLVDGGSTDGTIRWCKEQSDVTLIEQGRLMGAVKAFNAGAKAAIGKYVILANDDITFRGLSILRAFSFVERFKEVGVGCFYQDRGNQYWHVEYMPAISPKGNQISVPYGQVCIVPKWLGDHVGWWGNYLHTYGGDNELSCNILELGYDIAPIDGAYIHDLKVEDNLRNINKGDPRASGGMHPDSRKWRNKWTQHGGKIGPRLKNAQLVQAPVNTNKKRILYAPIYESNHDIQKCNKVGLHKALEKIGIVHEIDYMNEPLERFFQESCTMCPDLFILQVQDANIITVDVMNRLKRYHPDAIFVSWNGDYHPDNLMNPQYMTVMKMMNHAGFAVASIEKMYKDKGVPWFYWQIGYEVSHEEQNQIAHAYDVVFLGNCYTEWRKILGEFLLNRRDTKGTNVGLYGSWPRGWSLGDTLYDFNAGRRIYRSSKLAISDQQWPEATGYVSNRLFQAMEAGGCMVLQQYFDGMEQYLGLIDGEHLVTWTDYDELDDLIDYYLHNETERADIAHAGHKFMLENHSFDVRVQELVDVLGW